MSTSVVAADAARFKFFNSKAIAIHCSLKTSKAASLCAVFRQHVAIKPRESGIAKALDRGNFLRRPSMATKTQYQ
jgi:hypothetical protein